MERQTSRRAVAGVAVLLGWAGLTGCSSDDESPSSPVSSAASVVKSGASELASAASSAAASAVASAASSAEAAASSALDEVKGGLDAKSDVTLGSVATGSEGKAEVPVTIANHDSKSRSYIIVVDFKDQSGNLADVAVLDVSQVAAGETAKATARSNRDLPGTVTTEVRDALRY
ncbi:hypothetical protein ABZ379_25710 [Streptomyces canus]|uniref:hypothetical protein n=1 Tax=Streptomyces canus TaxID=58343 RepID=UPI0034006AC7